MATETATGRRMSIDDKLGCDKFHPDDHYAHIEVDESCTDQAAMAQVALGCPAELYHLEDGKLRFNYEGCLECGTCRVLGGETVLKSWNHPMGGMGIVYRMG